MWKRCLAGLLCLALLSGCQPNPAGEPASLDSSASGEDLAAAAREVTDPAELEQLWQDYLGLAIIPLQREFSFPEEADLGELTAYCWYSYARKLESPDALQPAEAEGEYILPGDEMLRLLERYFNWKPATLEEADPENHYSGIRYEPEENCFVVRWPEEDDFIRPGYPYGPDNPWDIGFESFRYNGDGTATAVLTQESLYEEGAVGSRDIYTMGVRKEGDLYFQSMVTEYVPTDIAQVTGDYTPLPALAAGDWLAENQSVTALVMGDSLILSAEVWDGSGGSTQLRRFRLEDWQLQGELELSATGSLQPYGSGLVLMAEDACWKIDAGLSGSEPLPLPESLAAAMESEHFGGYDVSTDGWLWVYSDEQGIQLLDSQTGELRCLKQHRLSDSGKFGMMGYEVSPQFVCGDSAVLSWRGVYEGYSDVTLIPVDGGKATILPNYWDVCPVGDQGLLLLRLVKTERWRQEEQFYYNCATESVIPLRLVGQVVLGYDAVGSGDTIAFVARDEDYRQDGSRQRLWLLNTADGTLTDTGVSALLAHATKMAPLAVLPDGRIVAYYRATTTEGEVFSVE